MASSAQRSPDPRVQPSRLVPIDSRRHIPKAATRTRIGVGDQIFDHAAGRPLDARQSFQGIAAPWEEQRHPRSAHARRYVVAPVNPDYAEAASPRDWDDQPSLHDRQRLQDVLHANDAPVELPLRSRGKMYLVVAALVVAFIAMLAGTFFAGATSVVDDEARTANPAP